MKRLFYTCRNVTGMFSKGLICNLQILEKNTTSLDFLTITSTNKSTKYIEEYTGLRINKTLNLYVDFYLTHAINMSSWQEVYDSLDVSALKDYDSLHIVGGLHFPQSNITRFSKRAGIFPADRGQLKFQQTAKHIINIMAIHKAHVLYNIPLHEFAYDSDEMSSNLFNVKQNPDNYHLYHIYDMPRYSMSRIDSLQYYLSHKVNDVDTKEHDLTFGYTIFSYGDRESYVEYVNYMISKFKNVNLYVKNAITKEDNSIDRDEYLSQISRSKYTLIIPSYDNTCFSLYRFIEAIHNDCLPIIHPRCAIDEVESSFNVDLKQLMITDAVSDDRRLELLTYLKSKFLVVEHGFK